jgi:hypothetical protein
MRPRLARSLFALAAVALAAACSGLQGLSGGDAGTDGGDAEACNVGTTLCSGKCVNTFVDPVNCGTCGFMCNAHLPACVGGVCVADAGATITGDAGDGGASGDAGTDASGSGDAADDATSAPDVPQPELFKSGLTYPYNLIDDGTNIYWMESSDYGVPNGKISSAPLDGGATTSIALSQTNPESLVVDGTNAYWVNYPDSGASSAIMSAPLTGSAAPTTILQLPNTSTIAVDATHVYAQTFPSAMATSDGTVTSILKSTHMTTAIVTGLGDSTSLLAIDAANVYYTAGDGIRRVAKGGGSSSTIAPGIVAVSFLGVDSGSVFWANSSYMSSFTGSVGTVGTDGNGFKILATATWDAPAGIVMSVQVDAIYYCPPVLTASMLSSELMRVGKMSGPATDLGIASVASTAGDATYLYYSSSSTGSIYRLKK